MPYAGPTEIHIKGEDWVRDGSWFVKKSIVDKYGSVDAAPPSEVEANRVSYPDGVSTQTVEQRAFAQGDPTGQNQFKSYQEGIGMDEFNRRKDLASSIGVNRSTDTSPAGVLADELFYGHMDELPGQPGVYFNARGDGTFVFKDRSGNTIPPSQALMQAGQQAVQQGYGTGAAHSGGNLPQAPGTGNPTAPPPTNTPPTKPNGPIFSKPKTPPVAPPPTPPVSPPQYSADSLQAGAAALPTAPMSQPTQEQSPMSAPPMGDTSIFKMQGAGQAPTKQPPQPTPMPNFMAQAKGGAMGMGSMGMPSLPQAPKIGTAASSFKIG